MSYYHSPFLLIDTWNGEGYSDSDVEIHATNPNCLKEKIFGYMQSQNPNIVEFKQDGENPIGTLRFGMLDEIEDNGECHYDWGCYHYEPLTEDMLAVALFPNINEWEIIRDEETLNEYENLVKESLQEEYYEFNEEDIYGHVAHCKGKDESDLILRRI
jgi:hypothetical protein